MAREHYNKEPSENDKKKYAKFLAAAEELTLITGYGSLYLRQRFIIQLLLPGGIFFIVGLIWAYFTKIDLYFGLILGFILSIIFSIFLTWIIKVSHKYILTTRRVIIREGFLSLKISTALYDKITHIEVDQGFMDRLFLHHGTVILNTAGGEKDQIILKYVAYPLEFKNILERLIHEERRHFDIGGPIETLEPLETY